MADIASILGVTAANASTVNGVAVASIASVNTGTWPSGSISTPVLLDSSGTTGSASSVTSASVSPTTGSLIIVVAANGSRKAVSTFTSEFTVDAWTQHVDLLYNGTRDPRIFIYSGIHQTGTGTVTATWDSSGFRHTIQVIEVTSGFNATTPVTNVKEGTPQATGTTASLTLDSTPSAGSIVLGAIANMGASTTGAVITPGTNFTELDENTLADTAQGMITQVQYDMTTLGTTVDWSTLRDYESVFAAIEVQAA